MLSASTFERVGTLEGIWTENRHLPSVIRLRSQNRNAPITVSFRKHMFDHGLHIPLTLRIAGIVHLYDHTHYEERISSAGHMEDRVRDFVIFLQRFNGLGCRDNEQFDVAMLRLTLHFLHHR